MPRIFVSSVVDAPAEKVWASDYWAILKGLRRHRWTRIFTDTEIEKARFVVIPASVFNPC
jgi:hypothetical protein